MCKALPLIQLFFFLFLSSSASAQIIDRNLVDIDSLIERAKQLSASNPDSGLVIIDEAIKLSLRKNVMLGKAYSIKANLFNEMGQYDSAISYSQKAISLLESENDTQALEKSYHNYGVSFFYQGRIEEALYWYLKSMEFAELSNDSVSLIPSYGNIAMILRRLGENERSKDYYKRALKMSRLKNLKDQELRLLVNLCDFYVHIGEYDSAIIFGELAEMKARELDFDFGLGKSLGVLSSAYIKAGESLLGLAKAREAQQVFQELGVERDYFGQLSNEALALVKLKRFDQAIPKAEKILHYAEMSGADLFFIEAYKVFSESYAGLGEYQKAYYNLNLLKEAEFKKADSEKNKAIAELETKYETEKKEHEILNLTRHSEMQELQISQQRTLLAAGTLFLVVIIGGGILGYRHYQLRHKQAVMLVEQKLLRTQMNPHFIFNSLTAIQSFIYQNKSIEAGEYMAKFAKLMRLILENSREDFIPLEKEVSTLTNYLELQQARFNHQFDYSIMVDENLNQQEVMLPPMFAQPFIENALEHGKLHEQTNGKVQIYFKLEGELIGLIIEDNGIGLQKSAELKAKENEHRSFATIITQERLELIHQGLRKKMQLAIENVLGINGEIQGTRVNLHLPLRYS